jgi:hypothetical protein
MPATAWAQRGRASSDQRSLLAKLQWVHFSIIGGRLQGVPSSFGSTVSTHHNDPISGRNERISVNVTTGTPAVHYESSSKREQVIVDVTGIDQLRIRRTPIDLPLEPTVEFTQESSGSMLLLAIGEGERREEFRAPGIWQLMLAQPELCAKHLTPLLELLRPEWRLTSTSTAVEETLLRSAQTHKLPDVSRWAALVSQLGADQFAPRQQAEKQLRRAGQSVLPYLHSLDLAGLSAEQRYRVRRLRDELLTAEDDNPERISTWLLTDASVWLSLLQREDAARRRAAAEHLTLLLGGPIDFDPDADAATRAAQWEALAKRVAKKS